MRNILEYGGRSRLFVMWLVTGVILPALFLAPPAAWAENCEDPLAMVVSVQGVVEARRAGEAAWEPVKLQDSFCPGDGMRVHAEGRSAVVLSNGSILRLDEKSTVTFTGGEKKRSALIDLLSGTGYFFSRLRRSLKITTPFVNANVEGTEFVIRVKENEASLSVFAGRVTFANDAGSITLTGGQSAAAAAGRAPVSTVVINPREAVQWALYYPPLLGNDPSDGTPSDTGAAGQSVSRASDLLAVGRIDEARGEIAKTLASSPENSRALSLQSIILIAQNKRAEALVSAERALAANSRSMDAHLALSYARQAMFDLVGARDILVSAVGHESGNALVWARLAEIHLSFGDLAEALDAAEAASNHAPGLERTQTVLGFAYLTRFNTSRAKEAFERAIRLDQASPLPRLGLGLAVIREGNLAEGREQIEIAVSLDPGRSILRSYLGKAFYDEKDDDPAMRQYGIARELDPLDPTPLFYSAIQKQTLNRPVEALHDLQESIALNDNRAVYRSRLLLDEDLAARSSSLARIYQDLGFDQLALVEGWKSLAADAGGFSAHRFLADSYLALPRHEIARVNELLQSQLLQPLNINPLQPQLAEGNTFILEGAGPAAPSFNEFSPLFTRNRLALQASGVGGGNDILGDEIVVAGIRDRVSLSLGQFHYETGGFRENNDLEQDLYNAFAQISLSHKTSLQAEYRHRDTESGDRELTFTGSFSPELRQNGEVDSIRVGANHAFTPRFKLMGSFIFQDVKSGTNVIPGIFELESESDFYVAEARSLFKSDGMYVTAGIGRRDNNETLSTVLDFFSSEEDLDTSHTNVYLYSNLDVSEDFLLTVGGSGDFLNGAFEVEDRNQFNPKLGLMWHPDPATTVRAAAFRTLQRPFVSRDDIDPTLEPTEVAGFNQFFFGFTGERAWRYGVGLDRKLTADFNVGAEFSLRDIDVVILDVSGPEPVGILRNWDEQTGRAYLYWTPTRSVALSASYLYEKFDRKTDGGDFTGTDQFTELSTHRVPIEGRYFHPCGFGAGLKAVYVDQEGEFAVFDEEIFDLNLIPGDDSFWVVDASLSYRLPRRLGIISLDVKNLFDEEFNFQDTDPGSPRIVPDRLALLKFTLAF